MKEVSVFIRSPAWIVTPFGNSAPRKFTEEEKKEFTESPERHLQLRKHAEATNNGLFRIFLRNSPEGRAAREAFTTQMKGILLDHPLTDKLIPSWALGCRRLTPGVGYLEALKDPKTRTIYGAVAEITPTGVRTTDGTDASADVIICASGFDTSFRPAYPVIGLKEQDLADIWRDEPKGYLGVAVPGFPNYFTFLGPNCPIGNGPVLIGIEAQGDYICKFLHKMQTEDIRYVAVHILKDILRHPFH